VPAEHWAPIKGAAVWPSDGHTKPGVHATGVCVPWTQKKPRGHATCVALDEPGGQYQPAVHCVTGCAVREPLPQNRPPAHGVGDAAPAAQKLPAGHALAVADAEPSGQ
jgi:hypothetical protein